MDRRAYPLRRIVGQTTVPREPWQRVELLECGHFGHALAAQTAKALYFDGTQIVPVARRRCFRCSISR